MSNTSGFRLTLGQILVRLSPLLLLGIVAFGHAFSEMRAYRPYEVGSKAIVYDTRANKIVRTDERVRVVATSLEKGAGVVAVKCDDRGPDALRCLPAAHFDRTVGGVTRKPPANLTCDTQLVVADAWEGLSAFCFERATQSQPTGWVARSTRWLADIITGGPEKTARLRKASIAALLPSTRQTCPEDDCLGVEHGGMTVDKNGDILLAEPHTDRVTTLRLGLVGPHRRADVELLGKIQYSGGAGMLLHDVAGIPGVGLVIAESSAADPKSSSVRLVPDGKSTGDSLVSGVYAPRPVGVEFSAATQRLYVTDVSHGMQRWMYVERTNAGWTSPRTFWTAPDTSADPPLLRHLVTGWNTEAGGEESKEVVFAAASDGLYVIDPAGLLLAKYTLGRPLSGVGWGGHNELFFTSGRFVGVLRVADNVRPSRQPQPGPPAPASAAPAPVSDTLPTVPPKADAPEPKPPAPVVRKGPGRAKRPPPPCVCK